MQTQFTSALVRKRSKNSQIASKEAHWELLLAYVQANCDVYPSNFFNQLVDAIHQRAIDRYFSICSDMARYMQKHGLYMSSDTFFVLSQTVAFLKKYPFDVAETPFDQRSKAKETLLDSELRCAFTNLRLIGAERHPSWVQRARRLINGVLGELTPSLIMKIITDGNHGPGGTLSSRGNRVTEYYKYSDFPYTVTKSASMYACAAISANPRWMDILESSGRRKLIPLPSEPQYQRELSLFWDCTDVADCDRITFVPKDAKTERPIAVGASLNIFLQLGVKTYMEKRLKVVGIDLTDQSKNQRYALLGSKHWLDALGAENPSQFSTIDLSSASDTISIELVRLLLDPLWFGFLDDLRHKAGSIDGEIRNYSKFCAMGNGFTFPLESLLFWAICKASIEESGGICTENDIAVYGDDIIVRYAHATTVITALEWSGFSVNRDKTFLTGPFKESCGSDYHSGASVRPFYLKRKVERYEDIYFVCNQLARLFSNSPARRSLRFIFEAAIAYVPRPDRNYTPLEDNSDSGLCIPFSTLRRVGFWPTLSREAKVSLLRHRLLDPEHIDLQCFYYIRTWETPYIYTGNSRVRLMIALDRDVPNNLQWIIRKVAGVARSTVTRRESTRRVTKVVPCSAWNGTTDPAGLNELFDLVIL